MKETLDCIIIGCGPTGINCGIAAQRAGLNYLIIEKGTLANSLFHFPHNMTFFSTSKLLEIADTPFISHTEKPTRKEALEYYRRLVTSFDLNVHFYEQVQSMSKYEQTYTLNTDKAEYTTKTVIVATGFYDHPSMLDVPGEELSKVKHYYDDAHIYVGQKILVVGAANSAADVALETWQKGAEVTMAVRGATINERVKYWIKPNIENRIKEGSITAYFSTQVREIKPKSVVLYNSEDGAFEIENDFVLAMTGYKPNYQLFENLGITTQMTEYKEPSFDESTLETNLPGVYVAGVVLGGLKTNRYFIENTRHHAQIIVDQIVKQSTPSVH